MAATTEYLGLRRANLEREHPCFALGKPNNKGRIHLPVSPGCNIECQFCERSINSTENRPGVAANVLTPAEALEVVRRSLELSPDIRVVGVAGPGDTLVTPYALETFRLVADRFPELLRCMSTNGLLLPDFADEIIAVGIDTLTVTVNDVHAATLAQICGRVRYHGEILSGTAAAELLIANQLEGIRRISAAGTTVKVNTVLIPDVNNAHIADIARSIADAGASLYNVIPLIPQHNMAHLLPPSCMETDAARLDALPYMRVFRHCRHCRADAIGVLDGEDFSRQIYGERARTVNTFSHG